MIIWSELTPQQREDIPDKHVKWLRGEDGGERANLYGANLYGADNIYTFGPIGCYRRIGYAVRNKDTVMLQLGCFWGSQDEALHAVAEKYGDDSLYAQQVKLACDILKEDVSNPVEEAAE